MAYWGQAYVLGPNINVPMNPDDEPKAYELAQKALTMKAKVTARERAYIEALATRYTGKKEDRGARDKAFAEAMRGVSKRYPNDLDAATIFAESLMDLHPWGYWTPDGRPTEGTLDAQQALESVMSRNQNHPGANHLWIHLVEATTTPERAEPAADRLRGLVPGAGHMVHMPAHIYVRVGRYADASTANEKAIDADEDYIAQCRAQGVYPMAYYPHNLHFLWWASSSEGRSQVALAAARKAAGQVSDEMLAKLPILAGFRVVPYFALTRFGQWDAMLAEPDPGDKQVFLKGVWHYARGISFAGKGQLADAEKELASLQALLDDPSLQTPLFSPNTGIAILSIAPDVLAGDIAGKRKEYDKAIAHLERAVRLEDGLVYTEPSEWHYPPRLLLGALLLEAGRPREAEIVYWEDLKRNRDNAWSLFGLGQALTAQNKDASSAVARFQKAWTRADTTLTASRF
jgi:tetratricopeptide (TPR) repeat protein